MMNNWYFIKNVNNDGENIKVKVYTSDEERNERCCLTCRHRIIQKDKCELDNHYIGYLECCHDWCRYWGMNKNV